MHVDVIRVEQISELEPERLDDSPDIAPGEASKENASIIGPRDAQARPGILMRWAPRGPPGA
jgi:hypothetical protein